MGTQELDLVITPDERVLVTGAAGFIGRSVVDALLKAGLRNVRCLARPSSDLAALEGVLRKHQHPGVRAEVIIGNLLSNTDCATAVKDVGVVFHLAAGRGEKSFPDAFLNSVVTTRNLLDACVSEGVKRFVNMSSFAVYKNRGNPRNRVLDEGAPIEEHPELRGNAYCFAKTEQDKLVMEYGKRHGLPYVIVRPGWVYGPGNPGLHGRVGIGTFGLFLHLGGSNPMPLTYVDNCAEAVVAAGLAKNVEGEVFNVVDDRLPSSRKFLRLYKRHVKRFHSIYLPHALTYCLCAVWEWYSKRSHGQLPPAYNRRFWHATWKRSAYTNDKLKSRVGWRPSVPTEEGLRRHFEACAAGERHA